MYLDIYISLNPFLQINFNAFLTSHIRLAFKNCLILFLKLIDFLKINQFKPEIHTFLYLYGKVRTGVRTKNKMIWKMKNLRFSVLGIDFTQLC